MKKYLLLALAGVALGFVNLSQAQVTLLVSADTYLTNDPDSLPTEAHGTEELMELRLLPDVRTRVLYFQFDLSQVTGDLSGATITLNATQILKTRVLDFYGVVDGAVGGQGENWDENTLSYSDAAGFEATFAGAVATTAELTSILAEMGVNKDVLGDYSTDTSTEMDAFLAADTNGLVTFASIYPGPDGTAQFFTTKENTVAGAALAARLYLPNATAVPEPATIALLLGGMSLLLVLYRRRTR